MSWSFGVKRIAELAAAVKANPHAPQDGRIEAAASAMSAGMPANKEVEVASHGHLNEDGSGSCVISVESRFPVDPHAGQKG